MVYRRRREYRLIYRSGRLNCIIPGGSANPQQAFKAFFVVERYCQFKAINLLKPVVARCLKSLIVLVAP